MDKAPVIAAAAVAGAAVVGAGAMYAHLRVDGVVDKTTEDHGGNLVAEVLKAHGVEFIFTLVGGHISPILVGCESAGIRVIDTRHEVTTLFAADAVARLSGVPGVAAVTAGPGLTNVVTSLKNAQMAETPVILLGGSAATLLKGRGALQDIDQMSLFKPICKWCATISRLRDIVPTMCKAFQIAQSGTPGPVFIEFPIDTLYPYKMVSEITAKPSKNPGYFQQMVSWYLSNHVDRMFAGAFGPRDPSPLPVDIPRATPSQMDRAAAMLAQAKRPVIVLGSQSTLPPTKAVDLRACLESMGLPCFLGGMSRGLLGRRSPIHIRQKRGEALREADVVILAGAVCDFRLDYGRTINRKSKIIACNRNKDNMLKNSDAFWKPTQYMVADVGTFLVGVSERMKAKGYKCPQEWLDKLKAKDDTKEEANKIKAAEKTEFINPLHLLHLTEDVMDDNSILVADGGDFVGSAAYILRPRGPLCWLDPGAFGTLGVGGGFALGAALVRPDAEIWVIYGDGSLGYSVAEFDTFTRFNLPIIALVGNDACWTQIAREQVPMLKSSVACQLARTDYHVVAKGYGGEGFRIDSSEEIEHVLKQAKKLCKEGKAVLINAMIGTTNFRDGSISV